jgi:hypothetical protein
MLLQKRKHGSQRAGRSEKITLETNWGGQGGNPYLIFKTEDDVYLTIIPESEEDVKALMSQAHIVHHNFK